MVSAYLKTFMSQTKPLSSQLHDICDAEVFKRMESYKRNA